MKKLIFLLFALASTLGFAQTTVAPVVNPHYQLFNAGIPCSGCLLDTFSAGTTTPLVTYSESTGTTPNANPVVADTNGFVTVYLTLASYKLRLRTAAGATLWTQDGVSPTTGLSSFAGITSTGNVVVKPSVAATGGANQSSPTLCIDGFYFNVTSLTDQWCLSDTLGTGTSPTSTFTLSHSGSGGAAVFSVVPNMAFTGVTSANGGLNVSKVIRDARQDGVKCDGTTDDSAAITLSLVNAYAAGQGAVQLPSGQCKVNTTINDTNKPSLDVYGSNSNEDFSTATAGQNFGTTVTELICNTGSTPCWDATGTGRARFKRFGLRAAIGQTAPSQVGFLFGRDNAVSGTGWTTGTGTYCFTEENKLEDIWIYFDTRPAATAVGSVGSYNQGAEQFQIIGGGYIADLPVMFGFSNILSIASPYVTLGTGCPASMSEVKIGHGASFQPWTKQAIRIDDQMIDFETEADTEIINPNIGTNHNAAFLINTSNANNIFLRGQSESFDFPIAIGGTVDRLKAEITAVSPVGGMLQFTQNNLTLTNSVLNFVQRNLAAQPLINAVSGNGAKIIGSDIILGGLSGSGSNASTVTLTESRVVAQGLTDTAVNTFASGSSYDVSDDTGRSTVGPMSVGGTFGVGIAAPTNTGILVFNPSPVLTGTSQFGIQSAVQTTSAATAEGAGINARADTAAAAYVQGLNIGVHVTTPTVGAGSTITEWDGVRIDKAPTAGTKCSLSIGGSTSGAACVNAPATAGVSSTLPSTAGTLTVTVGSGTAVMTTAGITTGACGTTVTVASTNVLTTDTINFAHNAAVTIGNGGGLTLNAWPTAGNVNFNYCNSSAGTITPTAMTINWNVTR